MTQENNERYKIKKIRTTYYLVDGIQVDDYWCAQQLVKQHLREDWFEALEQEGNFEVKPYHLELLRLLQFDFDHYEDTTRFRTIEVPFPQPFMGTGGWCAIMAGVMDIAPHHYRDAAPFPGEAPFKVPVWSDQQEEVFMRTFWEMRICLEILTYHLSIDCGIYRRVEEIKAGQYKRIWQKVETLR